MTMSDMGNESIRFFCLNLRFGLAEDGPNNWIHRKQCYPSLLEHHPCDFYGFQEANDFQIAYLKDLLPGHDIIGMRPQAPEHWQHNIIFHDRSWRCLNSDHFYLSSTPDVPSKFSQSQWPRQCTIGVFRKKGMRLTVINTHFDFEPEIQRRSAELILKRLEQTPPQGRTVLMGDLNAGPEASCIAEFTSKASDFRSTLPPTAGGTYHGFSGDTQGPNIDWILYRGGLEQDAADIVTEQYNGRYPSDHFPLIASFRPLNS